MHLSNLHNEAFFKDTRKIMKPLLAVMPKQKRSHSTRVARRLHRAGAPESAIHAGFAHDYLERGGDIAGLEAHIAKHGLSPRVAHIVKVLSSDEKDAPDPDDSATNPPLDHLRKAILDPALDQETRNLALLTKISDRLDNVRKRVKRDGGLHPAYRQKSNDIAEFARENFTGPSEAFAIIYGKLRRLLSTAPMKGKGRRRSAATESFQDRINAIFNETVLG